MTRGVIGLVLVSMFAMLFAFKSHAATLWTPQPERYFKYETSAVGAIKTTYEYSPIDEVDINPKWRKLSSQWVRYTTVNGGVKYGEEVIVQNPVPTEKVCDAFVCNGDFGVVFNMTKNTVLNCPYVKITKEQVTQIYDGSKSIDEIPLCPTK